MNKIFAPQESANDDVLSVIYVAKNFNKVIKGDLIFELEASKAVIEVRSDIDGLFYTTSVVGDKINVGTLIGVISDDEKIKELDISNYFNKESKQTIKNTEIEISSVIEKKLFESNSIKVSLNSNRRIAVLGGGMGLSQIMEILKKYSEYEYVGVYDDILWQEGMPKRRYSAPVLGPIIAEVIAQDFNDGLFDSIVISISTSIEFREKWMEYILSKKISFPSLVHPSAQVDATAILGQGNIVLPNVHIGPHARIGSNNFISAFSNIEHHCNVGDSNTFGPGVILSGGVKIGNRCKFGTGIFVEPKLKIGDDSVIASGQSINNHIKEKTIVKKEVNNLI
jgi:acetyltransferase-like isoleucine patch superfamily enzyme